jgi:hypothetical protein
MQAAADREEMQSAGYKNNYAHVRSGLVPDFNVE